MSAHYSKVRALGSGSIATVYEGTDEKLGRPVAIKELSPKLAKNEGFVEVFLAEAKRLGAITHPNIVQIFAVEEEHDPPWIISELADASLVDEIQQGPAAPDHVATVLRQLLLGLSEVHDRGLVHRNIKPSNILRSGSVYKLGDFGVEATDATIPYSTPRYISPEALSDPNTVSPAADLYSLGTVMYELLLGEPTFIETVQRAAGVNESGDQLWFQFHMSPAELPPLHEIDPNIPEDLSSVLQNMVRKDPEQRFATCADVLVNLDGILAPKGKKKERKASSGEGLSLASKVAIGVGGVLVLFVLMAIIFGGATVDVTSEPSGATVEVNGEVVGRTPAEGVDLSVGGTMTVRKAGYVEQTLVREQSDERDTIHFDLAPVRVDVKTTPSGASVEIDGAVVGKTPHVLEGVPDGTDIVLRLERYVPKTVRLDSGSDAIDVRLERASGPEPTDPESMIADLWQRARQAKGLRIRLNVNGGVGTRLPVGVPLSFDIASNRPAHLAIFTVSEDGSITCLYPNQVHSDLRIQPGEMLTVPSGDDRVAGFSLETDVPYGTDRVFVLASAAPLRSLPLTSTSTTWLSAYPFTRGPGGVPALAFYRWVVQHLDANPGAAELAAFEMEVVP